MMICPRATCQSLHFDRPAPDMEQRYVGAACSTASMPWRTGTAVQNLSALVPDKRQGGLLFRPLCQFSSMANMCLARIHRDPGGMLVHAARPAGRRGPCRCGGRRTPPHRRRMNPHGRSRCSGSGHPPDSFEKFPAAPNGRSRRARQSHNRNHDNLRTYAEPIANVMALFRAAPPADKSWFRACQKRRRSASPPAGTFNRSRRLCALRRAAQLH